MRTHGLAACGAANLHARRRLRGGRPSTAAPTSTPCAWPPRPRPVSASSAAARSSRRRVGPRCGHARRARPRAARAAPGPPIARGARRPRPAAVRGRRRRRGRTGHPSAQLREHGDRLLKARSPASPRPDDRGSTTTVGAARANARRPRVCVRARAGLRIACVRGAAARRARACWQLARSATATRRTFTLRACGSRVSRRSACQRRDRPRRQHARGARARAAAAVVVTNGPCCATARAARSRATHRLLARKRHAIRSGEDARAAGDAGGRRDGRPGCEPRRTGPATVAGPQPGRRRQLRPAGRRRPLGSGPAAGAAAGQRGSDADPEAA
jgi:hypothetical protein